MSVGTRVRVREWHKVWGLGLGLWILGLGLVGLGFRVRVRGVVRVRGSW